MPMVLKLLVFVGVMIAFGAAMFGYSRIFRDAAASWDATRVANALPLGYDAQARGWREDIRRRLRDQFLRRYTWFLLGFAFGYALLFAAALPLGDDPDTFGVMPVIGMWLGSQTAMALSVLSPVHRPTSPVRVSALSPHAVTDYLARPQILTEMALAGLGALSVAAAGVDMAGWWSLPAASESAVRALLVTGVIAGVVSTSVLFLQPWLVRAPLRAEDETQLVVADLTLARGMEDLYLAAILTSFTAAWMLLWAPDMAWWMLVVWLLPMPASLALSRRCAREEKVPPVAAQIIATSRYNPADSTSEVP